MTRLPGRPGRAATLVLLCAALLAAAPAGAAGAGRARLSVLTINAWTGLDYVGTLRMGEYETAARREERFRALVAEIRALSPDVVFLQEANPLPAYARRLAAALGYAEIHQVCNGGIKFGSLGIPSNMKDGVAILARPALSLEKVGGWMLSGSGIHRDAVTFHFRESRFALAGRIAVGGRRIYLVNVHASSAPSRDERLAEAFAALGLPEEDRRRALAKWESGVLRREREVARLLGRLREFPPGAPLVVAGDFNAPPDAPEMVRFRETGRLVDAFAAAGGEAAGKERPTWDPAGNPNVGHSSRPSDARGRPLDALGRLTALWDARPRRIDYVFLGGSFRAGDVRGARIVLDARREGLFPSDHYGVLAEAEVR